MMSMTGERVCQLMMTLRLAFGKAGAEHVVDQ
jgi:hypothetical protein